MRKAIVYFILGLTPLVLITLAQGPLLHYQTSFQTAKQQYAEALQDSRRHLADLGHELRAMPSLTENLDAASRVLSGFVSPGRIDHLAIYEQNCQLVAHSEQGVPLSSICPVSNAKSINTPRFQWRKLPHSITQDLVTPLGVVGEKSYFLLASVYINNQWLFHYPSLAKVVGSLNLVFGDPARGKILYEDTSGATENVQLATLSSTHPLLKALPLLARSQPLTLGGPLVIALAFFGVTVVTLIRALKRERTEISSAIHRLQLWADELVPDGDKAEPIVVQDKSGITIKGLQDRMSRFVKKTREDVQRAEHAHKLLQQQIVNLESRVLEQQAEQAWLSKARSMQQQMQVSGEAYLQKLTEIQSLGEDLAHLASHTIAKPAQRLYQLTAEWEAEMATVSARKFVRSLSERVDDDGISDLDRGLNLLVGDSQDLGNAAINVTMLAQKLQDDLKNNTHLALHWFRMMGHESGEDQTLLRLLQEGQSLIPLDGSVRMENIIDPNVRIQHLNIPSTTLTSILFHCLMALIENARESHALSMILTNQLKQREDKLILVLSLHADLPDDFLLNKVFPAKAEQHLSLALQLVLGYPIKITKLPALNGVHAIALSWDPQVEQKKGSSDMKLRDDFTHDQVASLDWGN